MQKWIVGIALISLAGCSQLQSQHEQSAALPKGVTLVEQVTAGATSDTPVIPYSKYTLSNGLTVVLHEDHSDPLVHVDVTYTWLGSRRVG